MPNAHVSLHGSSRAQGTGARFSGGSLWMYASSAAETRGCSSGLRYSHNQNASHTNPVAPAAANAPRQALCTPRAGMNANTRMGTTTGTSMAPTLAPELKRLVARARSFLGNHSATVLMQAGKLEASPSPRKNMAIPKVTAEVARPGDIAAKLHSTIAIANAFRVPSRSVNQIGRA